MLIINKARFGNSNSHPYYALHHSFLKKDRGTISDVFKILYQVPSVYSPQCTVTR